MTSVSPVVKKFVSGGSPNYFDGAVTRSASALPVHGIPEIATAPPSAFQDLIAFPSRSTLDGFPLTP